MRISSISFSFSWTEPQTEQELLQQRAALATSNNCKQLNKRHARADSDSQVAPAAIERLQRGVRKGGGSVGCSSGQGSQ